MRRWTKTGAVLVAVTAIMATTVFDTRAAPPGTAYPGGRWAPPGETYGVLAQRHQLVPINGVHLAVDVYYPAHRTSGKRADGTFPVLLTQTPYSGSLGAAGLVGPDGPGDYFVKRGYIYVSADVRGTGRSLGQGGFFSEQDALDGAALVAWAAKLDGSNGVVGLHGCSYLGATQLYTAGKLTKGTPVKAMIPACVKGDPYRDTYMVSGIPAPQWEGAGLLAGALLGPTIESYMVPKYLESQAGGDTAYYGRFWKERDHTLDAPAIAAAGIPALIWNGWDDAGFGGLELWTALQNAHFGRPVAAPIGRTTPVTGRYQLIVGDWGHGGGLDEGIQLQWYETWLKGVDTGLPTATPTPIHAQEQVSGRWSNHASYPLTDQTTAFTLGADGALSAGPAKTGTRTLTWAQPDLPGARLVYESGPFAGGATVAGTGALRVLVSSSADEVQLMVDVYDVAPDGTAVPITHGGVLGRMRQLDAAKSWTDAHGRPIRPYLRLENEGANVTPGAVLQLDVPLRPTLWRLERGHRLRLRLVGQEETARCFQKSAEVTTDAVGCRARAEVQSRLAGATFTVRHGPSFLNLPLVVAGSLPEARTAAAPTREVPLPVEW